MTVYSEDGSIFKQVQTCTLTDSPVCVWIPSFSKKGDLAFFLANGMVWIVPFDATCGFQLTAAKSVQVADDFSELVTNSNGTVLYALNPTTGHILGINVGSDGNLTVAAGSDVTLRTPPTGEFAAFSLGATVK